MPWPKRPVRTEADDRLALAPTLAEFLRRFARFLRECARPLKPDVRLAVLMGDYCDREKGFVPPTFHTKRQAFVAGAIIIRELSSP